MLENKKELILEKAMNVFSDKGLNNTSMEFLAEAAQVSTRTLYKHFSNKQDLFKEVQHRYFSQITAQENMIDYHSSRDLRTMLDDMVDQRMKFCLEESSQQAIQLFFYEALGDDFDRHYAVKLFQAESGFLSWLESCQRDGRLSGLYCIEYMNDMYHRFFNSLFILPLLLKQQCMLTHEALEQRKRMLNNFFINNFAAEP